MLQIKSDSVFSVWLSFRPLYYFIIVTFTQKYDLTMLTLQFLVIRWRRGKKDDFNTFLIDGSLSLLHIRLNFNKNHDVKILTLQFLVIRWRKKKDEFITFLIDRSWSLLHIRLYLNKNFMPVINDIFFHLADVCLLLH